jgi:hypothetical protein
VHRAAATVEVFQEKLPESRWPRKIVVNAPPGRSTQLMGLPLSRKPFSVGSPQRRHSVA